MKCLSLLLFVCLASVLAVTQTAIPNASPGGATFLEVSQPIPSAGVLLTSPNGGNFGMAADLFDYNTVFTLHNLGSGSITIESIGIYPAGGPFQVYSTTCGTTLPGGDQCTLTVQLAAQVEPAYQWTLTIDTTGGVASSPLTYMEEPDALLTAQLGQGNEPCNQEIYFSPPCQVTVTNYQPIALAISSIEVTPPFVIVSNSCPSTLPAYGGQCVVGIEIGFSGTYASGTLTVRTNSRDQTPPPLQLIYCGRRYCG